MSRRLRGRAGRSPVRPVVLLSGLLLLTASGTAWTAGMTDVPVTSVQHEVREPPELPAASAPPDADATTESSGTEPSATADAPDCTLEAALDLT